MPNIKSAIKRVQTSEKANAANTQFKSAMRTAVKKTEAGIVTNDANVAQNFAEAASKLDKAAGKGLIHKNAAARKKSRLAKKINSLNA
ncbi:30S ribosomal protein S20 [Bacillus marasmi]|uniref:30S ribosomal protein S20 n=1 Tax=Bacillus marasmi TaxID=1926279 RepID=UPI0011CCAE45|nr:30S ribosomal protein S20 [Bacillus marasmi]